MPALPVLDLKRPDLRVVSKGYQTRVRNPQEAKNRIVSSLGFAANVKKVSNGRLQGLDPGKIAFFDFPLRLQKSLK
jgi:hypothetical protein